MDAQYPYDLPLHKNEHVIQAITNLADTIVEELGCPDAELIEDLTRLLRSRSIWPVARYEANGILDLICHELESSWDEAIREEADATDLSAPGGTH